MGEAQLTRREFINTASKGAVAVGAAPYIRSLYARTPTGTGYIYDEKMLDHIISPGHVECPERIIKIQEKMVETGLDQEVVNLPLFDDPFPYVRKIHTDNHISSVQNIPDTNIAAETSVAGTLGAAKAVCEGTIRNAFCNTRP